jgi:hypothetical protein
MQSKRLLKGGLAGIGLLCAGLACNVAVGGGVVALVGGAGYFASQCYDHVKVRVRDAGTRLRTCDADVAVSEGSSERLMSSCYYTTLTEGRYAVTARREGYVSSSTEVEVTERSGACPHYVHSVELTLWPIGTPRPDAAPVRPQRAAQPAPAPAAKDAVDAPSPIMKENPPASAAPSAPPPAPEVPTRAVEPLAPAADAGAPP